MKKHYPQLIVLRHGAPRRGPRQIPWNALPAFPRNGIHRPAIKASSLLNEQNNHILFPLTMVTVLALPINIVAGFFGMNVGGIPFADDPEGFWIMLVLVASFTFLAGHWAFRKRGDY